MSNSNNTNNFNSNSGEQSEFQRFILYMANTALQISAQVPDTSYLSRCLNGQNVNQNVNTNTASSTSPFVAHSSSTRATVSYPSVSTPNPSDGRSNKLSGPLRGVVACFVGQPDQVNANPTLAFLRLNCG